MAAVVTGCDGVAALKQQPQLQAVHALPLLQPGHYLQLTIILCSAHRNTDFRFQITVLSWNEI